MVGLISSLILQIFSRAQSALLKTTFLVLLCQLSFSLYAQTEWQTVQEASVEQSNKVYVRGVGYYTDNTISIPAGVDLSSQLRLVVTQSSHDLDVSDGIDSSGLPYFDLSSVNDSVRIYFKNKRARFSYSAVLQQMIETSVDSDGDGTPDDQDICPFDSNNDADGDTICGDVDICPFDPNNDADGDTICGDIDICPLDPNNDEDGDGICFANDLCPADFDNLCITINGLVLGNGAELSGANVIVGTNTQTGITDGTGDFSIPVGPGELSEGPTGQFFPIEVSLSGYANALKKVLLVTGVTEYTVTLNMQQHSTVIPEGLEVTEPDGVAIIKNGDPVGSLKIPTDSLPSGVESVSGNVTYLAPGSDDLLSMPGGDLLAIPLGADPNDEPVSLETFGMMEFNLFDQNGAPITLLDGPAEVCMAATPGLSENETVELWYYDEDTGVWIEEGLGTVVLRDGALQICGNVTHFTWWNYDRPISTHACLRYIIEAADGSNDLDGIYWYSDGATYNGSSPGRNCTSGSDNFDSFSVKKSDGSSIESIRIYGQISGVRYYLVGDVNATAAFTLTTNVNDAAVFTVPTDQGSCISGSQSGTCTPIDYQASTSDGILQVDSDIDLPPVISDFSLIQGLVFAGGQSPVSAMVTDPDGGLVNVTWSVDCNYYGSSDNGSMSPSIDSGISGATFEATFTAPSTLSNLISYCSVQISAVDIAGNTTTATQWVTIAQSSVINVSGILYGTDGNPMGNHVINYDNGICSADVFQQITTDTNGVFNAQIDLALCDFNGDDFFYLDLGYAWVDYMQGGNLWSSFYPLQQGFGNEIGFAAVTAVDGEPTGCNVGENGSTNCNVNIYLPVLWADISGKIGLPTIDQDYLLDISVDNTGGGEFGGFFGEAHQLFALPIAANASVYGPIAVPVGQGYISLAEAQAPDIEVLNQAFELINTLPTTLDIGELLGEVQVTVEDDAAEIDIELNNVLIGTTGTNGEPHTIEDVSVGGLNVNSNLPYYYFYGYLQDTSTPMLVDLGSSELCTVNMSLFSPTREPLGTVVASGTDPEIVRTVYVSTQNSSSSLELDENGMVTFTMVPGYLYIDYYGIAQGQEGDYYGYMNAYIANCRGARTIQVDMATTVSNGFNEY